MPSARQLLKKVFPPMLATLADGPPRDDANWSYELKYDGFRAVIGIAGDDLAMLSRNEIDLGGRFPKTFQALKKIKAKELILDGEVVVLDEKGAPRFQLLQQGGRERMVLFDILWIDGQDLRRLPYLERRALLEEFGKKTPAGVTIAEKMDMPGDKALKVAAKGGWEGIIAKRNDSKYESRRTKDWLKVKALQQQELVIVGFQLSSATTREIGSLHLGFFDKAGDLRYGGKVGTGFSSKLRGWLRDELQKDAVPSPLVKDAPRDRNAIWVRPRHVAQVAFTEWTSDNRLRHPAFLGLRDDKEVKDVVQEKPTAVARLRGGEVTRKKPAKKSATSKKATATTKAMPTKKASPRNLATPQPPKQPSNPATQQPSVTLTNPTRVLYPRDGITKQDLVDYYEAVTEPMLRALKDRPLALEHWNAGIDQPSWFHQNIGKEGPDWLTLVETPTRTTKAGKVKHLVVDRPETLRWLGQMSVLTTHMWSSRAQSLEQPDWIVFDLDPAKGKGIEQAIEAALVMRKVLESLELPSIPKTSGKRGIHLFVPVAKGYSHEEAADFACSVAAAVCARVPFMTVERSLASRRGRLYLDCMQNGYGKTMVAPYSPRAIDGAPVSAPLKWSEITKKLDPLKYTIRTMPNRLAKVGDLFADVLKGGVKLPQIKDK